MIRVNLRRIMPPAPSRSRQPQPATTRGRRRHAGDDIPRFALYGEAAAPEQELLHIEEIQSRSRLYHWEIEPHVHQGLYQVLWVFQGGAQVVTDEHSEAVRGPVAIVTPPSVVHGFRFAPDTDGLVLSFSPRFLVEGDFHTVGQAFGTLFASPRVLSLQEQPVLAQRLDALIRQLAEEYAMPGTPDSPVVGWLARSVVWRLAQAQTLISPSTTGRSHRHQALFTRFMLLVEEHFLEHWPLSRYASQLGLSVPRLNRIARAESGHGALEIVHERLTREACRRLTYIATSSANVAAELGFEDPAYFSRFFKKRTGLSPGKWREAHAYADGGLSAVKPAA